MAAFADIMNLSKGLFTNSYSLFSINSVNSSRKLGATLNKFFVKSAIAGSWGRMDLQGIITEMENLLELFNSDREKVQS